eukprot:8722954-Pyramimonas_sp.AAC.1
MIAGFAREMKTAEPLLVTTMEDWEEKVNKGKTERLRLGGGRRGPYDVRAEFEVPSLRHIGGIHGESGSQAEDTAKRVAAGNAMVRALAKGWSLGTAHGRGRGSGVGITTRLHVLH